MLRFVNDGTFFDMTWSMVGEFSILACCRRGSREPDDVAEELEPDENRPRQVADRPSRVARSTRWRFVRPAVQVR
jgi:hypothetical protein